MIKTFCDVCGNELQNGKWIIMSHWEQPPKEERFDLCSTCYEQFAGALIEQLLDACRKYRGHTGG